MCRTYGIPLISGKDSMKNDYKIGGKKISIPPTVLITSVAAIDDVNKVVSMDVKQPGGAVYVLGETYDEMGGSEYLALRGQLGVNVPKVYPRRARALYEKLSAAMARGLVSSCHDCSDGGLAVALAESAFAGGYGMNVDIGRLGVENPVVALFSESQSRFVATVSPAHIAAFEAALESCSVIRLGEVTPDEMFRLTARDGVAIAVPLAELKEAWQRPLRW
jgi:phosphoribosylformylglycinamidine synthase